MQGEIFKRYRHRPAHRFQPHGAYIVTAGIYGKRHILSASELKSAVCANMAALAEQYGWQLQAWSVWSNHYHFVALAPEDATTLKALTRTLHSQTAIAANRLHRTPGRRVWYQYWDSCIDSDRAYYERLKYVHLNPLKHGWEDEPEAYPFCSYGWFLDGAESATRKRVASAREENVQIYDDF